MRRAVVVLLVVALVVGAGGLAVLVAMDSGSGDGSPKAVPTSTPGPGTTDPPDPALRRFYSQQLEWEQCRGEFLCSTLEVPLDYRRPGGRTIEISVLKVPAADPGARIGSLVVNPGGPGVPGTDYAAGAATVFRQPLLDAYDIVGFDPRGTGTSTPVDCLDDGELDDYIAKDPDPDTDAEVETYSGWVDAIGEGCEEESGELAAHVTTIEAARDIDVLRATLGESQLAYFGASYGTKLGATYAELFPDRAGRLVLDGAVDLSIGSRELSLQQAGGFETALRAYVQDCVDQDDCVLGDSLDEGLRRVRQLLDDVDAEPLDVEGDRDLEVGNAFYGIVLPLYAREYWPILTQALEAAIDGDGTPLLRLSDVYNSRGASGYTDNSSEANYAISCLDDPWAIPASEVPENVAEFEEASPTFGTVFAWGLTGCGGVRVQSSEPPLDVDAAGAAPIVVVGTTRDPATPYEWAVQLADQLDPGVLVTRDGDGHTGYNAGNECVDSAIEDFLVDGTVPEDGLRC